jgi:hypothetical protein
MLTYAHGSVKIKQMSKTFWIFYLNDGQESVDDFVARVLNLLVSRPLLQLRHVVSRKNAMATLCSQTVLRIQDVYPGSKYFSHLG